MRFRLYGGAGILPHLPHHGACRALSATGCAPLRRSSPSDPLAPWERCVLSVTRAYTGRGTGPNTRQRFQGLGGLQAATQKRRKAIHPGEVLQLVSYGWSGRSCPLVDREGLFQDSSGATRMPRTRPGSGHACARHCTPPRQRPHAQECEESPAGIAVPWRIGTDRRMTGCARV